MKSNKNNDNSKNYLYWIKKTFWLFLAIIMMSFSHSIFTYTRMVGMSPLTAATESISLFLGQVANVDGYSLTNYLITTILIIAAIVLSSPEERWVTASCAITGYGLAIVINIFIVYIVGHLPGLTYDSITEQGIALNWIWAITWYLVAYVVLVNSIGIWINVGFGLRPYDAFLVNLETKTNKSYLFWRNIWSLIFVLIAIAFGLATIGIQKNWSLSSFVENSAVGPMTIITIFLTGRLTKLTRRLYSQLV